MTFADWVSNSIGRFKTEPVPVAAEVTVDQFKNGMYRRLPIEKPKPDIGAAHIYDQEWDVLIVCDALRPDVLRTVSTQYPWLETESLQTYMSLGSYSLEWLQETFTPAYSREMQETAFVSWNPYTDFVDYITERRFGELRQPYYTDWSDELGQVPPESITDNALDLVGGHDKLIAWYMQPHAPHRMLLDRVETLSEEEIGNEDNGRLTIWNLLRSGEIDPKEAHIAYADSLMWALDDMERLIRELPEDATVRLTADHSELFGEQGRWGHPKENYQQEQLEVPLMDIDQTRVGESVSHRESEDTAETVEQQLEALGYMQ